MVPANWEHPRDTEGNYIPLLSDFKDCNELYNKQIEQWKNGFYFCFIENNWKLRGTDQTVTFEDYCGARPEEHDYMPDWAETDRTHYQMYETTTEGTPISPVIETAEGLAHWLADNNASSFGQMSATYDQWLAMINGCGWATSAVIIPGKGLISGVEATCI
ncbi:MAG: hypothetical protein WCT26_03735 [Candidatus Buchananbacteria bacterium]|jgi:hypothetical protein